MFIRRQRERSGTDAQQQIVLQTMRAVRKRTTGNVYFQFAGIRNLRKRQSFRRRWKQQRRK